jgi:hypothetical protein
MPTFRGVCRIRGTNGQPNHVRVTDGDMEFNDVDEQGYHRALIHPPLGQLPWCDGRINDESPNHDSSA